MTAPIPLQHGYNDYGRFSASSDITVVDVDDTLTAVTTYGPFFVGNLDFIWIEALGFTAAWRVTVNWYTDSAALIDVEADVLTGQSGDLGNFCLPIKAHWVRFQVDLSAYSTDIYLRVVQVPNRVNAPVPDTSNALIREEATSVGAGLTDDTKSIYVRSGWAYWQTGFQGGTAWVAGLYAVNFAGTNLLLDVMGSSFSKQGRLVFLPAMPVRVRATNQDGVARDLYTTVLFHPHMH